MKLMSIRVRLTAWYSLIMVVSLCLFGAVADLAIETSIRNTVNEGLEQRIEGVREIIVDEGSHGTEALKDEFQEYADGQGKNSLLKVVGGNGSLLFLSPGGAFLGRAKYPLSKRRTFTQEAAGKRFRVLHDTVQVVGEPYDVTVATALEQFNQALERFRFVLFLAVPAFLVFAGLGGYWLSRRALAPVDEITQASQDIGAQDLGRRLVVRKTGDELQRLGDTLNGMLGRLENAFQQITRFTADASHELRTPVSIIRTSAEITLRKQRSETEYRETLTGILHESLRMSQLIEHLLILARSDAGRPTLAMTRIDLKEPLNDACQQAKVLAQEKRLAFTELIAENPLWVQGDPSSMERLFLVILDNAVKYTPERGSVEVAMRSENGFAVVSIRDSGIGMRGEDITHIFERFYRADRARSRESGGSGLGLSIGTWIAQAHGGEIRVESELTKGSCFEVRLPLTS